MEDFLPVQAKSPVVNKVGFLGSKAGMKTFTLEVPGGQIEVKLEETLSQIAFRALSRFVKRECDELVAPYVNMDLVSAMSTEDNVSPYTVLRDPYVMVCVSVMYRGEWVIAYGFSKRNPVDRKKLQIGVGNAIFRAYYDAYGQILAKARESEKTV